jgi:hypothetical protein
MVARPRGLRGLLALALALVWLRLEGAARAEDPLAQARKAVAESDYGSARSALTAALNGGGRGPEDVVEIYRLTGIVDAALGDARAATEAFTRLLAMSPRAVLPDGTSPKIRRPFDAAVRYIASHAALEVRTETRANPPVITLVVVSDPLNMVATARAVFTVDAGAERRLDVEVAADRAEVALPPGRRLDARIAALDVHGNRLVEIGSREVPIVIIGDPPRAATPAPSATGPTSPRAAVTAGAPPRPIYLRWWPYAAAGAAALAVTVYFGLSAQSDADELDRINPDQQHHRGSEIEAVEDRAQRHVLFTNIGLGVTGGFALAAGVLYLIAPREHVETRVAAVPLRGGGGALVLGGRF